MVKLVIVCVLIFLAMWLAMLVAGTEYAVLYGAVLFLVALVALRTD